MRVANPGSASYLDQLQKNRGRMWIVGPGSIKVAFLGLAWKRIQFSKKVLLLCPTEFVYSALLDFKSCSMLAEKFWRHYSEDRIVDDLLTGPEDA